MRSLYITHEWKYWCVEVENRGREGYAVHEWLAVALWRAFKRAYAAHGEGEKK